MAIEHQLPLTPSAPPSSIERVEAWTVSQAADALAAASLSAHTTAEHVNRAAKVTIDIPLDDSVDSVPRQSRREAVHTVHKRREPIRRDSQRRREALLKGKEGSRRRQRWENDQLLSNPYASPPLPSDWEVRPTHPRQAVPYFLAPLWDAEYARSTQERKRRTDAAKAPASQEEAEAQKVAQDLRAKLKKSRGAKGLLQDLEQEVRGFVKQWEDKERQLEESGLIDQDSEDDEIVFVGRDGTMNDDKRRAKEESDVAKDKLIFESLVDDHGASFGYVHVRVVVGASVLKHRSRYLVHSIATYYGLQTWSITTGDPARREAYVGLKVHPKTRRPTLTHSEMPRPLWAVV